MAELPDNLERLENIAADLRARLARIEDRIRRLKDARWQEFQRERNAALGVLVAQPEQWRLMQPAIVKRVDGDFAPQQVWPSGTAITRAAGVAGTLNEQEN